MYGLPIGGSLVRQQWAIDGSGSSYIWGLCDSSFREGMSRQEAEQWVVEAIAAAFARDGSSGGVIRLVTVNKDGAFRRMVQGPELPPALEEVEHVRGMILA